MKNRCILIILSLFILSGCGGDMKNTSSLKNGVFSPCPSSPNCVSTMDEGKQNIQPLSYTGKSDEALAVISDIVLTFPGTLLVEGKKGYLHFTVKSRVFGFIDDLEVYLPEGEQVVHFRSAARTGYYDFGVNRKRLDTIKSMLQKTQLFQ